MPEDFPVTEGMVTGDGEASEGDLDAFPLCDFAYPRPQGTAHAETWFYSGDGESSTQRTFQLWPDEAAANASLDLLVEGVQDCPQQPTIGGEARIESKLVDFATDGDRSVTFAQQVVEDDGLVSGLFTVEVTRVGNAVLVDSSYGSAGGDQAIGIATQVLADHSATTRAAMCVFAADPCPGPEAAPTTPIVSGIGADIPADFPLDRSLEGAAATDLATGPPLDVCGTPAWQPSGVQGRLATRSTDVEYLQQRELVTFITADEASETMTQVRDAVTACPHLDGVESVSPGYSTAVLDGPEGYDSFTWGFTPDEGLGGGVFQLTRVGSGILALYVEGEMSETSLQPSADALTEVTLDLAPEMCVFTEDGC
jgi:hypothetical protein